MGLRYVWSKYSVVKTAAYQSWTDYSTYFSFNTPNWIDGEYPSTHTFTNNNVAYLIRFSSYTLKLGENAKYSYFVPNSPSMVTFSNRDSAGTPSTGFFALLRANVQNSDGYRLHKIYDGSDSTIGGNSITLFADGSSHQAKLIDGSKFIGKSRIASTATTKGTTSYGNISSASSGAYPTNSYSGSYWYVLQGNDTIDPSAVSYGTPHGGELLNIVVTPSASTTYGGTVKYKYEISTDGGGTWTEANAGTTATTISVLVPAGVETFQARVTASDDMGFTSTDTVSGEALTVINNTVPVITCDSSALGDITAAFNVAYSVSDADGNTMTITEALDGTAFNTFTTTGGNQTLTIDADRLLRALNGAHTLTITADDGNGGVTTHSITFTKAVYTATITRAEPMDADDRIAIMVMHVVGSIPADADYKVEVTNNALDASPVWEDVTSYIKNDNIKNYSFANTTCTSGTWAFNFRVTVSRGSSGVGGYITSLDGAFEGSVA